MIPDHVQQADDFAVCLLDAKIIIAEKLKVAL